MAGGKAGRFACIFAPMVLTMATLCLLSVVGLGQTNSRNNYLSNLYFARFNMTGVTSNPEFTNNTINQYTDLLDRTPDGKIIIQNFYSIGLWNYCAGAGTNTTKSILAVGQQTAMSVNFCSGRQLQWGFDPSIVWGMSQKTQISVFGSSFNSWMQNTYLADSRKWISALYILAVTCTAIQILVGVGGLFSRLGSLFTTIFSLLTTSLTFSFALLMTLTYLRLMTLQSSFATTGVEIEIGATAFIYVWFAWSLSFVGSLFWAFSSCCCSGRSRGDAKSGPAPPMAEHNPYTYERVTETPYGTTQTVTSVRAGGYEPGLRHGQ